MPVAVWLFDDHGSLAHTAKQSAGGGSVRQQLQITTQYQLVIFGYFQRPQIDPQRFPCEVPSPRHIDHFVFQ
jgi:hypothetical protein